MFDRCWRGSAGPPLLSILARRRPCRISFQKTWAAVRGGRALDFLGTAAGRFIKNRRAIFCLAEGARQLDRAFLARCSGRKATRPRVPLSQDVSNSRQLARFWGATDTLEVRAGILGMARDGGTGHKAILRKTLSTLEDFCTPYHGAPPRGPSGGDHQVPAQRMDDLYNHIRNEATEVWNTDAGADEILAGKEAKLYGPRAADVAPILPALKMINRDRAHASRRVVKRPWSADDFLASIHANLVMKKTSMVRVIQYSPAIKKWYQEFQGEMDRQIVGTQKD